jgi:rubrerythrin
MKSLNKTTFLEAIAAAIEHEVKSFQFFLTLSEQLKSGATKELFQQLATDGDEHIVFIKEIYVQAEGKELPNLKTLSEIHKFHSSTIQKLMDRLERNMNQEVESDEKKAMEIAVTHGEDAKKFYGKLKDKFPDPKINLLFSRLQDFIDTNTKLIEAQILAMGQSSQPEAQFFWEDEELMEEAAKGVSHKISKPKPVAKSSEKSELLDKSKEKTKTVTKAKGKKKAKPKSKVEPKSITKVTVKAKGKTKATKKTKPKTKSSTKKAKTKVKLSPTKRPAKKKINNNKKKKKK